MSLLAAAGLASKASTALAMAGVGIYQSSVMKDYAQKAYRAQKKGMQSGLYYQMLQQQQYENENKFYSQQEIGEMQQNWAQKLRDYLLTKKQFGEGSFQANAAKQQLEDYSKEYKRAESMTGEGRNLLDQRYLEAREVSKQIYDESKQIYEEQKRFLQPYMEGGQTAFMKQQALAGLAGEEAQQAEYDAIQNMPGFKEMIKQGEDALLANASATGGVRGGNTAGYLANYRPQMLRQEIMDRYNMYGGLAQTGLGATQMGLDAAKMVVGAGNVYSGGGQGGTGVTTASGYPGAANMSYQWGQDKANATMGMGAIQAGQFNWIPQSFGFLTGSGAYKDLAGMFGGGTTDMTKNVPN